jgi:hypothetical protein
MQFTIDGQPQNFVPIKAFRTAQGLPSTFSVAHFQPKDYTGLGRIDQAGVELNQVRGAVLAALPTHLPAPQWLAFVPGLVQVFEQKLNAINPQVGLKAVEIEFAVGGFSDVCQAVAYALLRAQGSGTAPEFQSVYRDWINGTVRVFSEAYPYAHAGEDWRVQVVAHAYGRIGLIVRRPDGTDYVYDPALACPAEGFMAALLADVGTRMIAATA